MIFDTHAHYDDEQFDEDRDAFLAALPEKGVGLVMNPAVTEAEFGKVIALCDKFPHVYGALGAHPENIAEVKDSLLGTIRKLAVHPKIRAIGEIGLDYYWNKDNKDAQKFWLGEQIELAKELHLPVIIHDRDAHKDTLDVLCEHKVWECGGVFHCYSGSAEMLPEILDWGMYVGFGGVITFKNAQKNKKALAAVPLDRLVVETDAPYMAPVPFRGKRNSSEYLSFVLEAMAQIKGVSREEIEAITFENGKRLYGME